MVKPHHGDLVRVTWEDPRSDSAWTETEDLTLAECVSIGIFNFVKGRNLFLYASWSDSDIGDRTIIPVRLIKRIDILKEDEHRHAG